MKELESKPNEEGGRSLKVVIINKSDSTGGAAVVSRRLMEALRTEGVDARMLVAEKLTDSPYVEVAANATAIKSKFLLERLKIYLVNGLNRTTLFRIDTGEAGLPLWRHHLVKEADAVLLNWFNQGFLSLRGLKKIRELGKPVIWTMHDMWAMTGICHHAGSCRHYLEHCGDCPLLGRRSSPRDLSHRVYERKAEIYSDSSQMRPMAFVAVSHWLRDKALESSLLCHRRVKVINNAFDSRMTKEVSRRERREDGKIRILFGAARLDDPIKGLDTLKEMCGILKRDYGDVASRLEIALFGGVKNPDSLQNFALPLIHLGMIKGEDALKEAYLQADILVSASSYETFAATLQEAQAYGSIPVSFNRGGQGDIVEHLATGYLAEYDTETERRAGNLAKGVVWAAEIISDEEKYSAIKKRMLDNVRNKFSYSYIAKQYKELIKELEG